MSISSETRKAGPFTGNGSTTAFPFAFKVFAEGDVRVVRTSLLGVESDLVLNSDYTVALNADQDVNPGGTVNLTAALADDLLLTLTSKVQNLQPLVLTNPGGFFPSVINTAFDRAVILVQQLSEGLGRALKVPISSGVTPTLPSPEANSVLAWNEDADGFVNVPVADLVTVGAYGDSRVETFAGDGSETDFELDFHPGTLANMDISIDGVVQVAGTDFTRVGQTVVFASAPPASSVIAVRYTRPLVPGPDAEAILSSVDDAEAAAAAAAASAAEAAATLADRVPFTTLAANAGSTLVGFIQSGTGAILETLQTLLRRDRASPEQFGAVGDGSTDDTLALQRLFTAHTKVRLGWLKTYRVTGELTFQSNTDIQGFGARIVQATDQTPIFDGRGITGLRVRFLKLRGKRTDYVNSSSALGRAFRTDSGSDGWSIRHCEFEWFTSSALSHLDPVDGFDFCFNKITGPGLVADGGSLIAGSTTNCFGLVAGGTNIRVAHNSVKDTAQGIFLRLDTDGFTCDFNRIENTLVEHGIYGDTGLRNGSISGNVIKTPYIDGIKVQQSNSGNAAWNVSICRNVIYQPGGNGIGVPSVSNPATVFADGFVVADNAIYKAGGYGIVARGLRHSRVGGNVIFEAGSEGLIYRDCTNVQFDTNLIVKSYRSGVFDESGNVDCSFVNNKLFEPGTIGGAGGDPMGFIVNSLTRGRFFGNEIIGDVAKMRYAFIVYGGTDLVFENNRGTGANEFGFRLIGGSIKRWAGNSFEATSGPTLGLPTTLISGDWSHSEYTGSAAPGSGTFPAGAFVRNVDPADGEPFGWVCTVAGAPGTWVPVGVLGQTRGVSVGLLTVTATSGSLPTPNDTVTIANAATPTEVELLEFCVENKNRFDALVQVLRDAKVIAS